MAYAKAPLVKHLMEKMGVADVNYFWVALPDNQALTRINEMIGTHLGRIEDAHRMMSDELARLARAQAKLAAELAEAFRYDYMWVGHHAAKVTEAGVEIQKAADAVRELMWVRDVLIATTA